MKWLNVYFKIIEKGIGRKLVDGVYYEKHHIIPKSIYGDKASQILNKFKIEKVNGVRNLVHLTAREHFFCHVLLTHIFRDHENCYIKMLCAFNFMSNRFNMSSRGYQKLKKEYSISLSNRLKGKTSMAKGKKWSEEAKKNKSENHYMKGRKYEDIWDEETTKRLKGSRQGMKGYAHSEEAKKLMSERVFTPDHRRRISEANKGREVSEETKNKISKVFGNSVANINIDRKFYLFEHNSGQTIIARKHDMKKMFGVSNVHKLIDGRVKIAKGWKLVLKVFVPYGGNIKYILEQNEKFRLDWDDYFSREETAEKVQEEITI